MADASSTNPYIRTFAKDVAALQGKPPPPPAAPAPALPVSSAPAAPTEEVKANADRESVLARLKERAAKDPVKEGNFLPTTLPTPLPKAASVEMTELPPLMQKAAEPEVAPAAPQVSVLPESSGTLIPQAPVAPQPSVAPVEEAPIIPQPTPAPEPLSFMPPAPPQPVARVEQAPAPAPQPIAPASESPIHTYKSDFSDRIDTERASTFSVLAAQSDAGALAPAAPTGRKHHTGIVFAAAGVALIILAGGGAYAAYRYVSTHSTVAVAPLVPSLVFADDRQAVTGEGPELLQALASSGDSPLADGQVRILYLTEASTTPDGKTVMVPLAGGRLIGSLQLAAPDILLRNIAPESTVGVVHAGPETRPFFILKVLSYERTFAGMLQWEGTMETALASLYPEYPAPPAPGPTIATTTKIVKGKTVISTTTIPAAPVISTRPRFIDEVASNHDVRALKDGQGRTIFLYGYKDKETLVIARDEAAFGELLTRLAATKQQ